MCQMKTAGHRGSNQMCVSAVRCFDSNTARCLVLSLHSKTVVEPGRDRPEGGRLKTVSSKSSSVDARHECADRMPSSCVNDFVNLCEALSLLQMSVQDTHSTAQAMSLSTEKNWRVGLYLDAQRKEQSVTERRRGHSLPACNDLRSFHKRGRSQAVSVPCPDWRCRTAPSNTTLVERHRLARCEAILAVDIVAPPVAAFAAAIRSLPRAVGDQGEVRYTGGLAPEPEPHWRGKAHRSSMHR
jgi:hypothetical protein